MLSVVTQKKTKENSVHTRIIVRIRNTVKMRNGRFWNVEIEEQVLTQ